MVGNQDPVCVCLLHFFLAEEPGARLLRSGGGAGPSKRVAEIGAEGARASRSGMKRDGGAGWLHP